MNEGKRFDVTYSTETTEAALREVNQLRGEVKRLSEDWIKLGIYAGGLEADRNRLRGLLARLEWAGTTCYDAYGAANTCPACRVQWDTAADFKGHALDCWLAAELHPRENDDS